MTAATTEFTGKVKTLSGYTNVQNGVTTIIQSSNSSYTHYQTDAPNGHWFNTSIRVKGDTYGGTSYNRRVMYYDEMSDSGWIKCTMGNGIEPYHTYSAPQVRRIGNIVYLRGVVKNSTAWTSHASIITIPAGYSPEFGINVVCHGSQTNKFLLRVFSAGLCSAERYFNGATENQVPVGVWLNLFATWIID